MFRKFAVGWALEGTPVLTVWAAAGGSQKQAVEEEAGAKPALESY